jgi:energy-coupling factor transport system ATP-binding protein
MNILEVKNVTFAYEDQQPVINDLTFRIKNGEYICLIGHNGSGKSTIAKLLIGLLAPQQGTVTVDGILLSPETVNQVRSKVGIVFQNPDNQFIGSTVEDDIAFGLENHQIPTKEMPAIVEQFAKLVKMEKFLNSEPTRLSGGQKQRVAIAGVLAMAPDLIIFDEATSMLDPTGKKEIITLAKQLHTKHQKTILSITHDMEEVANSDYVIVLNKGKIILEGKPLEVMAQYDLLKAVQLDVPFVTKMAMALQQQGMKVDLHVDAERLVEQLWQLNSTK